MRKRKSAAVQLGKFPERQMLNLRQFSAALGMSHEWARKQLASRKVSFAKIGKSIRIPSTEVDRFIEENFVPAGSRTGP
jgi:excisionase family DNA binding protein